MTPPLPPADTHPLEGTSLWHDAWKRFHRNRAAVAGGAIVLGVVVISLVGPWLVYVYNGFEYDTLGLDHRLANPSVKHLLGTRSSAHAALHFFALGSDRVECCASARTRATI